MSTRQAPFLSGLVAMFGATFLLFVGETIPVLMVARVLQGISAAFVWTIGMALCLETVGSDNLGKTIGTIFSFISVGPLLAPVLGGVLYERTGYNGVWALCYAFIGLDFVLRIVLVEKKDLSASTPVEDMQVEVSDLPPETKDASNRCCYPRAAKTCRLGETRWLLIEHPREETR